MNQLVKSRVGRVSALAFGVALMGGGLVAFSPASPALAGPAPSCTGTIGWSGGNAQCTVPAGVTTLTVIAVGASGAAGNSQSKGVGGAGGLGSTVKSNIAVTPGQVLTVVAGGKGGSDQGSGGAGGFGGGGKGGAGKGAGGGGGGGGASAVQSGATVLVVAAGGGGGGGATANGYNGGAAGSNGANGKDGAGTWPLGGGGGGDGATKGYLAGTAGSDYHAPVSQGGGGGGGGGGLKSGDGAGAGGPAENGAGGGGGGASSTAGVQSTTNVGNGSVSFSAPTITNTGLPGGITTQGYDAQLTSSGGVGTLTWSLASGALPANVTLNPATGELSGNLTAGSAGTYNPVFRVTDGNGASATATLPITIIAQGSQAAVVSSPATAITTSSATGNGIVAAGTTAVTQIFCSISNPSLGLLQQVAAVPPTAAINAIVNVTCPFTGLADNTTFVYTVSAVDTAGTHRSETTQSFTTLDSPSDNLTADVKPPASIKWKGKTTLLPKTTWALNNGNKITKVKVSVKQVGQFTRGDVVTWKVVTNKRTGKVEIVTYGKKTLRLQVTYKASAAGYEPWSEGPYSYLVKRPLL